VQFTLKRLLLINNFGIGIPEMAVSQKRNGHLHLGVELQMSAPNTILAFVMFIVAACPSPATVGPKSAETRLLEAIQQAYVDDPNRLLIHGPQIWLAAVRGGHTQILHWLMVNEIPGRGFVVGGITLWHFALYGGNMRLIEWLQQNRVPGRKVATSDRQLWQTLEQTNMKEVIAWLMRTPEFELSFAEQQIVLAAMPFMYAAFKAANALRISVPSH
jgi:hypothetical protein